MVEIKLTFGSADEAITFLAERSALTKAAPQPAVTSTPATTKAAADPKPAKAQKAEASSPSAVTAETASAAAETDPVASPPPVAASTAKPLEYASSDLPKRIAEMVGLGHTAAVKALLAEFGAKKGPEIPAERLNEFDEKLKALETGLTAA